MYVYPRSVNGINARVWVESQHAPFNSAIEGIELIELPDRVANNEVIFEAQTISVEARSN